MFTEISVRQFPNLTTNQCVVVHAEVATGIVCTEHAERITTDLLAWPIFPTFNAARAYANQLVRERPQLECHIYNHDQQHIARVWNAAVWHGQRLKQQHRWWEVWKRWRA